MPRAKHAVALDFLGWKKYPAVRPGPIVMGTPPMNNKFPRRIKDLLKKREMPNMVKTVPEPNNAKPMRRSPFLMMFGKFGIDGAEER
jgi:hypothetical protein